MKYFMCWIIMFAGTSAALAQNEFKAIVKDQHSGELLPGVVVTVDGTGLGAAADENGLVHLKNIPDGDRILVFSLVGYEKHEQEFSFPMDSEIPVTILLAPDEEELEEIVVSTTRGSRSIADEPTRIEAIAAEELDEKSNMKPGDIRMLLFESTGIQTQQNSATSANTSIRIQGLEGRHTQILKDGFPLYAGLSSGLSIMQIPPLDLNQVEVIKGSASTLYGGGAISGIINLISKRPSEKPELTFHANVTSASGLDLSGFYARQFEGLGMTVFAASNASNAYDPAGIGLSAIPEFRRYTLNPRVFYNVSNDLAIDVGVNASFEDRLGGDMKYINGTGDSTHSYFEKNRTDRVSTQLGVDYKLGDQSNLRLKNSFSHFGRLLETPSSKLDGTQLSSVTEVAFVGGPPTLEWIVGTNLWTDDFSEATTGIPRDYEHRVYGGFVQNTWQPNDWLALESGLRTDVSSSEDVFVLPRVSALFMISRDVTSRVGGGLGYAIPTIFTGEAEELQFENILPIDESIVEPERSLGGNADINFRSTLFAAISLSMNVMLFYTRLDDPLELVPSGSAMQYVNADGHIDTHGSETNVKLGYEDFKLFLGHTFTSTRGHFGGTNTDAPLTPRHKFNSVLIYEVERTWRIGLEAYYFDTQLLRDGTTGQSYWICGFMAERIWGSFSLFINFENLLDSRQTRFDTIYTGTITNPQFRDIYAPVDGFVMNGGVKIRL